MSSTPEAGFLADIVDNPDDDTPRLVFADWLEDHGQADRAEFIRVQIALARLGTYDPARADLQARVKALLAGHREAWVAPFGRREPSVEFARGFAEEIYLSLGRFLREGRRLMRVAPVRKVSLNGGGDLAALAGMRELGRVEHLVLMMSGSRLTAKALTALLASPHLDRLRRLDLHAPLTGPCVRALARSRRLGQLTHLGCHSAAVAGASLAALLDSGRLAQLRSLELRHNGVLAEEGLRMIAAAPALAHLTRLDLSYGNLHEEAGAILAESPHLRGLEFLNLHFNELHPTGAAALASSPILAGVRELDIGFNEIDDAGVSALARSRFLEHAEWVQLSHSDLSDEGLARLAGSPLLGRLRKLELDFNDLTGEGVRELARAAGLAQVIDLDLSNNEIDGGGAAALAASPHLAGLQRLDLRSNVLGNEGARALARSPHLGGLRHLGLGDNDIGPQARRALQKRFGPVVEL
jgi:uncharacterized protein (TIGR02996 family)